MEKIAIIEDDFLLALVMKKHLQSEGYECFSFTNATDFLSYFETVKDFKVIILDVKIKGPINGLELFAEFSKYSSIPVIFSTGNSDLYELKEIQKPQVKKVLIKPISLEELSMIINALD